MSIFIVRHGQSIGNIDLKKYQEVADHAFELTELGVEQSKTAAKKILPYLHCSYNYAVSNYIFWNSSFDRARQTTDVMTKILNKFSERKESSLLIEKQYGLYNSIAGNGNKFKQHFPKYDEEYQRCHEYDGRFFARPPGGESDFDVYVRTELFWSKLLREDPNLKNDHIIVCHGTTMRILTMAILEKPYEWSQNFPLPNNGDVIYIDREWAPGGAILVDDKYNKEPLHE